MTPNKPEAVKQVFHDLDRRRWKRVVKFLTVAGIFITFTIIILLSLLLTFKTCREFFSRMFRDPIAP